MQTITSLNPLKKIITELSSKALSIPAIIIAGSNGKSTTCHFLQLLCAKENIQAGFFQASHFQSYNEHITLNKKEITNAAFAKHAQSLLKTAHNHNHVLSSHELLFGIFLLHNVEKKSPFIVAEQAYFENQLDPVQIITPKVIGITRLTSEGIDIEKAAESILQNALPTTFVISADQSKNSLQQMSIVTKTKRAQWIMPIRKVSPLPYPYEQIHGRCATLAEKIALTYIMHFMPETYEASVLLNRPKKQRGRPTLATKQREALTPQETLETFWQNTPVTVPYRFDVKTSGNQTVVLDCANSIDAFNNLFLGVRLLSYKQPVAEINFIVGSHKDQFNNELFIKKARYFFKRNNGKIFFCPVQRTKQSNQSSWDEKKYAVLQRVLKSKLSHTQALKRLYKKLKKDPTKPLP